MNNTKQKSADSKSVPNIFNYATSELSQDAFILWLLDWANPQYAEYDKALCDTAQDFVRLLLNGQDLQITTVKCKKQENHIDVFAIVNERYALIVEDKTNTTEHGNQIKRYSEWVKRQNKYSNLELHSVYYKSGNESIHKLNNLRAKYTDELQDASFRIIGKENVLDILQKTRSHNAILLDYIDKLRTLHERTNAYKITPYTDWKWEAWQGFYLSLEEQLGEGDWGYVANPSGGFLGYWWHWCPIAIDPSIELYLQFEQDKLCIKAYSKAETQPILSWTNQIVDFARANNLPVRFPDKRRKGKTMTLAVVDLNQLFDIPLNLNATIQKLTDIASFVSQVSQKIK